MEKTEREFVAERELVVKNVTLSKYNNDLKKVSFEVEGVGTITFKPVEKLKQISDVGGVECVEEVNKPITLAEAETKLAKVFEIKSIIDLKHQCKIKAAYQVWNTEQDGQPATYRYFMKKHFDEMVVLDSKDVEELVH